MVLTASDIKKLKENEPRFIDKPFSKLLKEIKPAIRMVSAQSHRPDGMPGYIILRFIAADEYYRAKNGNDYFKITVFIKENFDWDRSLMKPHEIYDWTKEDEKKYGGLTVVDFWVSGKI